MSFSQSDGGAVLAPGPGGVQLESMNPGETLPEKPVQRAPVILLDDALLQPEGMIQHDQNLGHARQRGQQFRQSGFVGRSRVGPYGRHPGSIALRRKVMY